MLRYVKNKLNALSVKHHNIVGIKPRKAAGYRKQNLSESIIAWQVVSLRRSKYLTRDDDCLSSIPGQELDPQLLEFSKLACIKSYFNISREFLDDKIPDDPQHNTGRKHLTIQALCAKTYYPDISYIKLSA